MQAEAWSVSLTMPWSASKIHTQTYVPVTAGMAQATMIALPTTVRQNGPSEAISSGDERAEDDRAGDGDSTAKTDGVGQHDGPERGVGEDLAVVGEADEVRLAADDLAQTVVLQREQHHPDERPEQQHRQHDERGREQQPRPGAESGRLRCTGPRRPRAELAPRPARRSLDRRRTRTAHLPFRIVVHLLGGVGRGLLDRLLPGEDRLDHRCWWSSSPARRRTSGSRARMPPPSTICVANGVTAGRPSSASRLEQRVAGRGSSPVCVAPLARRTCRWSSS